MPIGTSGLNYQQQTRYDRLSSKDPANLNRQQQARLGRLGSVVDANAANTAARAGNAAINAAPANTANAKGLAPTGNAATGGNKQAPPATAPANTAPTAGPDPAGMGGARGNPLTGGTTDRVGGEQTTGVYRQPTAGPAAAAPTAPASTTSILENQFGAGNPFGMQPGYTNNPTAKAPGTAGQLEQMFGANNPFTMQSFYGGNPIETATNAANRNLDANLASVRARAAANGIANSSYQGQAEGQAIGDANAQIQNQMAQQGQAAKDSDSNRILQALIGGGQLELGSRQIGAQERSSDANRMLEALLGAGNQQIVGRASDQNTAGGLGAIGSLLTQIGVGEQTMPNTELLTTLLGMFGKNTQTGTGTSTGHEGTGFQSK